MRPIQFHEDSKRAAAPMQNEIPALLESLGSRVKILSEMQAQFHGRLAPVMRQPTPAQTNAVEPSACTELGGALAAQIARIDCMIEEIEALQNALAL
jgi:hypothetical protein